MFNHENYLQMNGTAMGTRVVPTYINLFMNSLEKTYIYPFAKCPRIWFRLIDDIWGILRGTEQELNTFVDYCNSFQFVKHSVKLHSYLSLRGYPPNLTIPVLHRCNNTTQHEALLTKQKEKSEFDDNSLFCITEFNPLNTPIQKWIQELGPI